MGTIKEAEIIKMLGVERPVLLLDSADYFIDNDSESYLISKCYLNKDLFFWEKHFVNDPVMPGTYMLEMLAQSAALFEMIITGADKVPIITAINNVRFLREVKPEHLVSADIKIKNVTGQYFTTFGKIHCEGKTVCKAEMIHFVKDFEETDIVNTQTNR